MKYFPPSSARVCRVVCWNTTTGGCPYRPLTVRSLSLAICQFATTPHHHLLSSPLHSPSSIPAHPSSLLPTLDPRPDSHPPPSPSPPTAPPTDTAVVSEQQGRANPSKHPSIPLGYPRSAPALFLLQPSLSPSHAQSSSPAASAQRSWSTARFAPTHRVLLVSLFPGLPAPRIYPPPPADITQPRTTPGLRGHIAPLVASRPRAWH